MINESNITLLAGIKPTANAPYVKVVSDLDKIYCSDACGFVYTISADYTL